MDGIFRKSGILLTSLLQKICSLCRTYNFPVRITNGNIYGCSLTCPRLPMMAMAKVLSLPNSGVLPPELLGMFECLNWTGFSPSLFATLSVLSVLTINQCYNLHILESFLDEWPAVDEQNIMMTESTAPPVDQD